MNKIRINKYFVFSMILIMFVLLVQANPVWAQDKKVVKIGFIDPLTGANAAIGLGARNSVLLAVQEANASGEFPYRIEVVAEDDASDPATGVAAAMKLCADPDVVAAITHYNSPVGLATIHVFNRAGIAQIFPSGIQPEITDEYGYLNVSRICANNITEHDLGIDFLMKQGNFKRWANISTNTSYGENCSDNFHGSLEKYEGTVVTSDDFVTEGTKDFRPILTKIKKIEPVIDAIYYGGMTTEGALIKRQMEQMDMDDVLYFAVTGIDSAVYNEIAGDAAEGTLIVGKLAFDDDHPFVVAYEEAKFKEPYEATGPYAYEAAGIILQALKEVGPDRQAIIDYIASPGFEYNGILGKTVLNENRQSTTGGLEIKVSQDGKWLSWDDSEYASGKRDLPKK